ncbi:thiamine phosphate synthase [Paenibacillus sp. N4]|uniref:thiamine phosphate synthase n=1 Tax=Paenibacillus vietnamensis TaxID=2590547 RepID=UPI002964E9BF|nr:thiamine phosphate synthase [Paenibacillus vietnamensis]MCA0755000.1 thiamine phosphate synthase [Paenibacillus vietnamensis]
MGKDTWKDFRLYVITAESNHPGKALVDVMEQTLIGGADILQLRNKTGSREEVLGQAKALRELTRKYNVPFIINDYPDIVLEVDADGVHLGQEDLPIAEARRLLGPEKIIGISTHSLQQALAAERDGADYIGVGPVFPTDTKPGRAAVTTSYVAEAARHVTIPFVAIGGITLGNVDTVLASGARRICSVSAIVGSSDPAATCRSFLERIEGASAGTLLVNVNGREQLTSARTIEEFVKQLEQHNKKLVVERNGELVPRALWAETELLSGDAIELVHFVGGG